MNYAVIFAGGSGLRMNSGTTPKQFLRIHGRTILEHTMRNFEDHPLIDGVVVVCLPEWIDRFRREIRQQPFSKILDIVPGGADGQGSIFNGLQALKAHGVKEDSIVLIHDGVRPLIDAETIERNIAIARERGNAITTAPQWETVVLMSDEERVSATTDRHLTRVAKAPQTFVLGDLLAVHEAARETGRGGFVDTATLMQAFGHELHVVWGPADNIKVTTATDFYILRAILDARETSQVFG